MRKIILFLAICVGIPFVLVKCMETANSAAPVVEIVGAFSYPTMGMMNMGVAFMEIKNNGKDDAVTSVETPIAGRAELHNHVMDNGVMQMRKMDEVKLPAGEIVKLKSGGLHVMLFDLKKELKEGDNFPLTLKLKSGSKLQTTVKVEDRE